MHLRVGGRRPIGRNTSLYHAKGEIYLSLNISRTDTCEKIDNYVKWVLLRDPCDGKDPSWTFHCHGHLTSRPAANLLHDDDRAQS